MRIQQRNPTRKNLNPESYTNFATQLKLNMENFNTCSKDPAQAEAVKTDLMEGSQLGVSGTPAFFINGINLSGAQPLERFVEIIESELERQAQK